jgi:hypothetical protein
VRTQRTAIGKAVIALVAVIVVIGVLWVVSIPSQSNASASSSSCSGYPPGGDCLANYSYTFTVSVNYSGPWKLTYQGYSCIACSSNSLNVGGNITGNGLYSKSVILTGPNNNGLTLCATAQKLDGSNLTLILTVTGYNETSLPYGSTSYCGGVVP